MPKIPPNSTPPPITGTANPEVPTPPDELASEDFYYEGPYLVFTASYHIKRGYCCNSGCRHCPYGHSA